MSQHIYTCYTTYDPLAGTKEYTSLAKAKQAAEKQLKTYPPTHKEGVGVYKRIWTDRPDIHGDLQGFFMRDGEIIHGRDKLLGFFIYKKSQIVWDEDV
jgi:hypothetical protein